MLDFLPKKFLNVDFLFERVVVSQSYIGRTVVNFDSR